MAKLDTVDAAHRLGTVMSIGAILGHNPWLAEYLADPLHEAETEARKALREAEEAERTRVAKLDRWNPED